MDLLPPEEDEGSPLLRWVVDPKNRHYVNIGLALLGLIPSLALLRHVAEPNYLAIYAVVYLILCSIYFLIYARRWIRLDIRAQMAGIATVTLLGGQGLVGAVRWHVYSVQHQPTADQRRVSLEVNSAISIGPYGKTLSVSWLPNVSESLLVEHPVSPAKPLDPSAVEQGTRYVEVTFRASLRDSGPHYFSYSTQWLSTSAGLITNSVAVPTTGCRNPWTNTQLFKLGHADTTFCEVFSVPKAARIISFEFSDQEA